MLKPKPIRNEFLPPFRPNLGKEEINEVVDTLKSGWITTGPKVNRFEEAIKKYIGCQEAIAVSSCTEGLELCLLAAGIGRGDEVITSPLTFVSTANIILHQGAKPVFVDIDKETLNIEHSKIEKAITKRTKAIISVHYGGQPCDLERILKIAKRYNLRVIEDAAHAIGAEYKGKKIGTISDFTVFSFYAAKNLTTAEGGMICLQDKKLAERLKILSLHGISKDAWKRYSAEGSWYYEVLEPGYKSNMTDIQASLGIHQLRKLEKFIKRKEEIARLYNRTLGQMPEIIIPKVKNNIRPAWYLYPILLNTDLLKIDRSNFIEALKAENIGTSVHFIPVHLHPYYKKTFGFKMGDFPNSEYVYERIISLPIHSSMTLKDAKDVITAIKKIINYYKK